MCIGASSPPPTSPPPPPHLSSSFRCFLREGAAVHRLKTLQIQAKHIWAYLLWLVKKREIAFKLSEKGVCYT